MGFFKRKLIDPLLAFLRQGVSPSKLALAVVAGVFVATIPVFGAVTLVSLLMIRIFRLNPAAVLLVNQVAYPLQFLLYIPFIKAGQWLFNDHSLQLSVERVFQMFSDDVLGAIGELWWVTMYALVVWGMFSLLAGYVFFLFLQFTFRKVSAGIHGTGSE